MTEYELPLFHLIPKEHVDWALKVFRKVEVDYGQTLIEEGEFDTTLVSVLQGELEVRTGETQLATIAPGEIVGEIALFGEGMRMASVETNMQSTLLLLDREGYLQLADAGSPVAHAIEAIAMEQLMKRLAVTSSHISDLAEGTTAATVTPPKDFFAALKSMFGAGGAKKVTNVDPVAVLKKARFFEGATDGALQEVAARMKAQAYEGGSVLCTEGSLGEEMFVIAEGLVEVIISTEGDKVEPLATLEPGDAFGMLSLLEAKPRMASCVANGDVTVLMLQQFDWQDVVGATTAGGALLRVAMIRCVSDQLAFANAQLSQLDLTPRTESGDNLQSLLMAEVGMEAHGAHLKPAE